MAGGVVAAAVAGWMTLRPSRAERTLHTARMAVLLLRRGDLQGAADLATAAVARGPESPEAALALGLVRFAQSRDADGVREFERAAALDPANDAPREELLERALRAGDGTRAIRLADEILRDDPKPASAWRARALARVLTGDPEGAIADYASAAAADPADVAAPLAAARVAALLRIHGWAHAIPGGREDELFEMAAGRAKALVSRGAAESAPAARAVCRAMAGSGRDERAAELAVFMSVGDDAITEAALLLAKGETSVVEAKLSAAAPGAGSPAVLEALARLRASQNEREAALAAVAAGIERFPGADGFDTLARRIGAMPSPATAIDRSLVWGLARRGAWLDPLEDAFASGLARGPATAAARRARLGLFGAAAVSALLAGSAESPDVVTVRDDIRALLEADARDAIALTWRGALELAGGDRDAALASLAEAAASDPALPEASWVRGVALAGAGRTAEARASMEHAVSLARPTPARVAALRALAGDSGASAGGAAVPAEPRAAAAHLLTDVPGWDDLDVLRARVADEPSPEVPADTEVLRAAVALRDGRLRDAVSIAGPVLARDPGDAEARAIFVDALVRLGDSAALSLLEGRWLEAGDSLAAHVRRWPADTGAALVAAQCLVRAGAFDAAVDVVRSSEYRSAPDAVRAALARAVVVAGAPDLAADVLQGPGLDPLADGALRIARGAALRSAGRADESREEFLDVMNSGADADLQTRAALGLLAVARPTAADLDAVDRYLATAPARVLQDVAGGHLALARGRDEAALRLARDAVARQPESAEARMLLAAALGRTRDFVGARDEARRFLAARPDDLRGRRVLAAAAFRLGMDALGAGDARAAVGHLTEAVQGTEADFAAAAALAQACARAGDDAEAAWIASRWRATPSRAAVGWTFLGSYHLCRRDAERACRVLSDAAAEFPSQTPILRALVRAATESGDPGVAVVACRRGLASGVPPAVAGELLGAALVASGDAPAAEAALRAAREADPASLPVLERLARLLVVAGRADEARREIADFDAGEAKRRADADAAPESLGSGDDTAVGAEDGDVAPAAGHAGPERRFRMGRIALEAGDPSRAAPHFDAVATAFPGSVAANLHLVTALGRLGRLDEAGARYARRVLDRPQDAVAQCMAAVVAERQGRMDDAVLGYRAALAADPRLGLASNNLAWDLGTRSGQHADLVEGIRIARSAIQHHPLDPDLADTLGWLLHLDQDDAAALAELRRASAARPGDAGILRHIEAVTESVRRAGEARPGGPATPEPDPSGTGPGTDRPSTPAREAGEDPPASR